MKVLVLVAALAACVSADPPALFNGINAAWNHFGSDIGCNTYNETWFNEMFSTCQNNGVNSVRFWLHCDGRCSPNFANDGSVTGISSSFVSDLISLLTAAEKHSVVVLLSLWSFDMFKDETSTSLHPEIVADASKTDTYIQKALVPMLAGIAHFNNVIIEVMNEPEWGVKETPGTTKVMVPLAQLQRFTNLVAAAVHAHSSFPVTTGSASLKWDAPKGSAVDNWWNDTSLVAAGGESQGTLDFYQVHYYDWMYNTQWGYDPCREPTSYWGLDKPTVVGELPCNSQHYSAQQLLGCSLKNGFIGNMFWSYNDPNFPIQPALGPLKAFAAEHSTATSYSALVQWAKSLRP